MLSTHSLRSRRTERVQDAPCPCFPEAPCAAGFPGRFLFVTCVPCLEDPGMAKGCSPKLSISSLHTVPAGRETETPHQLLMDVEPNQLSSAHDQTSIGQEGSSFLPGLFQVQELKLFRAKKEKGHAVRLYNTALCLDKVGFNMIQLG